MLFTPERGAHIARAMCQFSDDNVNMLRRDEFSGLERGRKRIPVEFFVSFARRRL
jgi:hypothetical protein